MPVYSKSANLRPPSSFSAYGGQQISPYAGQQPLGGSMFDQAQRAVAQKQAEEALRKQAAQAASNFAGQGEAGYGNMTNELAADRERLRALASGQNSLAAEQLRQGLQSQYAQQQSMAAGASPGNAPMAARTAMMNMGRAATGMAGNAAMAGIAERNAATQALADLNLGQRGQDVNVGLGSRQNEINALGPKEPPKPTAGQRFISTVGQGAVMFSDERLKADIKDGTQATRRAFAKLSPKTYRYKDERMGEGEQLGFMAQDLEKAGLKGAVMDTPIGKAVNVGKLTGANTAAISDLAKRMAKIEKGGK